MTTEGLEQRITNVVTEYLGTNPYKDVDIRSGDFYGGSGGTTGTISSTTDLIYVKKTY